MSKSECKHARIEFLGIERSESGVNKYFRCLDCGSVLVLSEDGVLYEVPGVKEKESGLGDLRN
ncbi:MAG: hypothetical protein NDF55_00800 [archaeon GB-1867-005]|nr:hypothetical protein [Candidatus Culexmicrobium cathedralense]